MVLPSRMRKKLGLRKGMRLRLVIQGDTEQTILVQPIRPEAIEQLRGSVPGAADALDYLQKERKRDRERGR